MYFHLEHAHQERFKHKWGLFEEQFQVGKNKLFLEQQAQTQGANPTIEGLSVGGSSGSGTDKSAEVIAAEVIAAATETSKAGAETTLKTETAAAAASARSKASANKTDSKESVADKKLTALIKEAVVTKTAYKEATQQGRQFQSRVEGGGKAYEWAPSCKTYMRFIKFLDQCDKELTEFGKDMLLLKPKAQENTSRKSIPQKRSS